MFLRIHSFNKRFRLFIGTNRKPNLSYIMQETLNIWYIGIRITIGPVLLNSVSSVLQKWPYFDAREKKYIQFGEMGNIVESLYSKEYEKIGKRKRQSWLVVMMINIVHSMQGRFLKCDGKTIHERFLMHFVTLGILFRANVRLKSNFGTL